MNVRKVKWKMTVTFCFSPLCALSVCARSTCKNKENTQHGTHCRKTQSETREGENTLCFAENQPWKWITPRGITRNSSIRFQQFFEIYFIRPFRYPPMHYALINVRIRWGRIWSLFYQLKRLSSDEEAQPSKVSRRNPASWARELGSRNGEMLADENESVLKEISAPESRACSAGGLSLEALIFRRR